MSLGRNNGFNVKTTTTAAYGVYVAGSILRTSMYGVFNFSKDTNCRERLPIAWAGTTQSARVDEGRKCRALVAIQKFTGACRSGGTGEKIPICDSASELRLQLLYVVVGREQEKERAKMITFDVVDKTKNNEQKTQPH